MNAPTRFRLSGRAHAGEEAADRVKGFGNHLESQDR
jgi:hypothetical protein